MQEHDIMSDNRVSRASASTGPGWGRRLRLALVCVGLLSGLLLASPGSGLAQTQPVVLHLSTVALTEPENSADEPATTITATATRWKGDLSTSATTVTLSISGCSGDCEHTLSSSNNTITIAANERSGTTTFTITPKADTSHSEADKTIRVSGSASGLSVAPATITLLDRPHLSFPKRIYAALENPTDTIADLTVEEAKYQVGTVTYSHTAPSNQYGLSFDNSTRTLSGTLDSATPAGTTLRYTVTATDNMNTTSDTTDDRTATTTVSVSVITDQCSATTGGTDWKTTISTTSGDDYNDLVQNCNVLLAAKAAFEAGGTATSVLNWSASTDIRDWDGICFKKQGQPWEKDDKRYDSSDGTTYRYSFYSECNDTPNKDAATRGDRIFLVSLGDVSGVVKGPIPPVLGHLKGRDVRVNQNEITLLIGLEWSATHFKGYNQGWTQHVFYSKSDNNQITGPVPPELGNLDYTTVLSLAGVNLENHSLPAALADMDNLQYLYAFNTKLSGSIPPWLPELNAKPKPRSIYLNDNKLTGSIPWQLGRLDKLGSNLWLQNNQLSGSIPWQVGNSPNLHHLDLSHNQLSGSIPWKLGHMKKNRARLYLNDNQLTGTIPPYLAGSSTLRRLWLHNNQLTGSIPSTITRTTNMYMVYAGSVHDAKDASPNDLSLYGNQLTGTIVDIDTSRIEPMPRGGGVRNLRLRFTVDEATAYVAQFPGQRTLTGHLTINGTRFEDLDDDYPPRPLNSFTTTLPACSQQNYRCTSFPTTTEWFSGLDTEDSQTIPFTLGVVADVTKMGTLTGTVRISDSYDPNDPCPPGEDCGPPPGDGNGGGGGTGGGGGGGTGGGGGGGTGGGTATDHGDTPATATSVAVGSNTEGRINSATDVDYFTLTISQAGLLVVETTGRTNTQGSLTTPDGQVLVQSTTGGERRNFLLTQRVAAGTYFVAVSGTGIGSYELAVDLMVGFIDNPQPDSAQSGIGVLSGWVCEAETVAFELNGVLEEAAYGTERPDTVDHCGDTNTGFGLLYNWNRLGDGEHTVRVLVDGVEFATLPITVTTLGEEFPRGLTGEATLTDFPTDGESVRLEWQEAQQNFALASGAGGGGGTHRDPNQAFLENPRPGSFQSGISVLSGWACEADTVVLEVDGTLRLAAGYGTERPDTVGQCGDADNGFGVLFNWNRLDDGEHTVRLLIDEEEWATATFTVTTLGEEMVRGLERTEPVVDFPGPGETVTVEWQEAQQNFVITDWTRGEEDPSP